MDKKKHEKHEEKHEEPDQQPDDRDQKIADLDDQLKRAVADYRNLEKRVEEERRELIKYANRELLSTLLPAFDTLFLAEKYVQDDGLKLTIKSLSDSFAQVGVQRVETVGKDFDPHTMECVETVDGEENKVIDEVRPGFLLNEKLLRPAVVKVGKGKASD